MDPRDIVMICVTHIPTNSGIVNPVEKIGQILREHHQSNPQHQQQYQQIFYLVDACQSVGQRNINVQQMQCDALVGTGRKYLRGPRGTGFLYVASRWCDNSNNQALVPHPCDHYAMPVQQVPVLFQGNASSYSCETPLKQQEQLQHPLQQVLFVAPRPGARRFEFWESSVANRLGLRVAVQELLDVGIDVVSELTQQRARYLYDKLLWSTQRQHSTVAVASAATVLRLHHPPESGIVTFWVDDNNDNNNNDVSRCGVRSSTTVWKERLWHGDSDDDDVRFEVAVVPATSTPINSALTRVPNLLRVSVLHTTTTEELDLLCHRLDDWIRQPSEQKLMCDDNERQRL